MGVFVHFLLFCLSVGGFKQSANGSYLSHHTLNRCKNFNAAAGLYRLPATLKFHPKVLILGFVDNIQLTPDIYQTKAQLQLDNDLAYYL